MSNFTKEKWFVSSKGSTKFHNDLPHFYIYSDPNDIKRYKYIASVVVNDKDGEAKARLIAAAPEMYELLYDTWENDRKTFIHSLNTNRTERFRRIKALLDSIKGK